MAEDDPPPQSKYFNLTYPAPYVAHVEINRPERHNAFIEEMWLALPPLFTHLSHTPSCRAIILSGSGPAAFTTGLDIAAFSSSPILNPSSTSTFSSTLDPYRTAHQTRSHILAFQSSITAIATCTKPVVAALHGYVLGLGIDIAVCADVRICARDTKFAIKEVDLGLAADVGTLSRLPKVVRSGSWIKDVCLSGRVWGAEEAGRVGFVSWVGGGGSGKEEVMGEAVRWAGVVAGKSPVAVQGTKELLDWGWERSVEEGLKYTAVWNSVALQSADVKEALGAGLERRKARFEKL
ncbi:hypothetical protein MMC21_007145 [Puttea exsequens]|nr:hypothetical protein [Puttea exsequens]